MIRRRLNQFRVRGDFCVSMLSVSPPNCLDDPDIEIFRQMAARFFQREVPMERVDQWRAAGQVDDQIWKQAGDAGLLGVGIDDNYGGAGGDFRHDVVVLEEAVRHGAEGFAIGLHNAIVLPYVQQHGAEAQKEKWLPRLCSGELVSAIAMSEPGAGSDLQSIRTTAKRDGEGYRINGSKIFISNGQLANFIVVVAKTDTSQGARGISLFIVETEEVDGFRRGQKLDKIGQKAQDTSELFFDDVWVPASNLLGGEEGKGFSQLMAELPRERLLIAIEGVISMERALGQTIEYTRNRKAFGQPIIDFQNSQFKLAECKAKATVAKVFVNDCIDKAVDGTLDGPTSAIAKMWVTDTEFEIVDECLQLHGGYGCINEYPIARMYGNSRIQRIYGGSNEIMKVLIARTF